MKINEFENCAQSITETDLDEAQRALGYLLPDSFRNHYLTHNGGNPTDSIFVQNSSEDSFEVVGFYPIKYNTSIYETRTSLLVEHYKLMIDKEIIPNYLLPFAHDPGGNFFCLHLRNRTIVFYAADAFDPRLAHHENHINAQTQLTRHFDSFINKLTRDRNLDSDEWPD